MDLLGIGQLLILEVARFLRWVISSLRDKLKAIYKLKFIKFLQFQDTKWLELCNPTTGQANIEEQPPRAGGCGFKSHPFLHSKVPFSCVLCSIICSLDCLWWKTLSFSSGVVCSWKEIGLPKIFWVDCPPLNFLNCVTWAGGQAVSLCYQKVCPALQSTKSGELSALSKHSKELGDKHKQVSCKSRCSRKQAIHE